MLFIVCISSLSRRTVLHFDFYSHFTTSFILCLCFSVLTFFTFLCYSFALTYSILCFYCFNGFNRASGEISVPLTEFYPSMLK